MNTTDQDAAALQDAVTAVAAAELKQDNARIDAALMVPLDAALRRLNARPPAPADTLRVAEPLRQPSMSLDPGVLAALPEYDDTTKGYVGQTETAMSAMHEAITNVVSMREASQRNPTWNEAAAIIHVSVEAGKVQDAALRRTDAAVQALDKGITGLQAELRAPLQASAHTPLGGQITEFVRGLPTGERLSFLTNAIRDGDTTTLHAVLSRPAYLSGIDKATAATLTEQLNRHTQPEKARRLALMEGAKQKLEAAGGIFLNQMEAALGVKGGWATAQRLRAAQADAMKAFTPKG